jgi:iron(III) transport system ATP-binding protein
MIQIDGVSKRYGEARAVEAASLAVERGELVALLGPSGCGKTTLLRLVAGFETPDRGTLRLDGHTVASAETWVPPEHRGVGMVFQDYALFPHLSVERNVAFGLRRPGRDVRVHEVLELVGLLGYERRYPHELSGGQQQRVALARALAPRPSIVLLDEPWSNIDALLRQSMRDELAALLRSLGMTAVLVTHDREEAFSTADRIALMHDGGIVQVGRPEDVYDVPATRWAAEFVGTANFVQGTTSGGIVETALGAFPLARANRSCEVEVLLRPELLGLEPDPAGAGQVVAREFRGHDVFYRVRLDDGSVLLSQRPSTEAVPIGARVTVRPHTRPVTAFAS